MRVQVDFHGRALRGWRVLSIIAAMLRNVQMIVAYDGTDFHGWQRQGELRTVQAHMEHVLARVLRHPVDLIASGRTDAGVHAAGLVVNFRTSSELPPDRLRLAIDSRLDADVALVQVRDVPAGFHATRSALSKLYRYRIYHAPQRPVCAHLHRYVLHYFRPLELEPMLRAARLLIGTHDFKAMASGGVVKSSYVRTVLSLDLYRVGEEIRVDVRGDGFLYNQVRNMVGTLLEVGRGHWQADCISEILASRDRSRAGPTAPARGLCLMWVEYPPDELLHEPPGRTASSPGGDEERPAGDEPPT
jgi:tRNA pseudouridine38-40 synthase